MSRVPRRTFAWKMKSLGWMTAGASIVCAGICIYKENENFYNDIIMPTAHLLGPETAHKLAVFVNKYRLLPKTPFQDSDILKTNFLNISFPNPVGIAAGFDKHGESVMGLLDIGFGFVEIGSVTPLPQPGNPQPRVFRLPEDYAVINRYGFNSDGHEAMIKRIASVRATPNFSGIIGINLGQNKTTPDPIYDYVQGVRKLGPYADYLVVNVSSPNTPGLRSLQSMDNLERILPAIISERDSLCMGRKPPVLLKLAPDLTSKERRNVATVIKSSKCRVDGLIISNTTVALRDTLTNSVYNNETGGLSGAPLRDLSTEMISEMYTLTDGKVPIIGVGGIFTGQDAYNKVKAGASLIQVYTSFIYYGPPRITRIKKDLEQLLLEDGYQNISEAVGADVRDKKQKGLFLF